MMTCCTCHTNCLITAHRWRRLHRGVGRLSGCVSSGAAPVLRCRPGPDQCPRNGLLHPLRSKRSTTVSLVLGGTACTAAMTHRTSARTDTTASPREACPASCYLGTWYQRCLLCLRQTQGRGRGGPRACRDGPEAAGAQGHAPHTHTHRSNKLAARSTQRSLNSSDKEHHPTQRASRGSSRAAAAAAAAPAQPSWCVAACWLWRRRPRRSSSGNLAGRPLSSRTRQRSASARFSKAGTRCALPRRAGTSRSLSCSSRCSRSRWISRAPAGVLAAGGAQARVQRPQLHAQLRR